MVFTEKGAVEDYVVRELSGNELAWTYVDPAEMAERRGEDYAEPLVVGDVKKALRKINDAELSDADLDFIIVTLQTIPSTVEGIRRFLDVLRNGIVVPVEKENKEKVIRLVDFAKPDGNEFVVTNQYKIDGIRGNIRADVVLLINGIPLALLEAKTPAKEQVGWTDAYKQIKRYEEQAPDLFKYVQFSIATDGIKTRYFPNAFEEEGKDLIGIWKDPVRCWT